MIWNDTFLALFDRSTQKFQSGNPDWETYYTPEDLAFLASIGYQPREFFDFVEDFCGEGTPSIHFDRSPHCGSAARLFHDGAKGHFQR